MGHVHGVARAPRVLSAATSLAAVGPVRRRLRGDGLAHVPARRCGDVGFRVGTEPSAGPVADRAVHVARPVLRRRALPVRGRRGAAGVPPAHDRGDPRGRRDVPGDAAAVRLSPAGARRVDRACLRRAPRLRSSVQHVSVAAHRDLDDSRRHLRSPHPRRRPGADARLVRPDRVVHRADVSAPRDRRGRGSGPCVVVLLRNPEPRIHGYSPVTTNPRIGGCYAVGAALLAGARRMAPAVGACRSSGPRSRWRFAAGAYFGLYAGIARKPSDAASRAEGRPVATCRQSRSGALAGRAASVADLLPQALPSVE